MNMLNPEMRALCSFTGKEEQEFQKLIGTGKLEFLATNGLWESRISDSALAIGGVYRLKLKEGEWYTYTAGATCTKMIDSVSEGWITWSDKSKSNIECFESFRSATQAEINSVKPSFKRGDVVSDSKLDCYICRVESIENSFINAFSRMYNGGEFGFDIPIATGINTMNLATPDQIKQLELEEMKAGKSWNGDGYEDCLTADGLTLNELLEHDLNEIEYTDSKEWYTFDGANKSHIADFASEDDWSGIRDLRLKPQESFVDVEIDWDCVEGAIIDPKKLSSAIKDDKRHLQYWKIGFPRFGWVLSGYKFADRHWCESEAIVFTDGHMRIDRKATHARFVRLEQ